MSGFEKGPILVTGVSGCNGAAIVRQLVGAGADVVASWGNVEQLNSLAVWTGCRTLPFKLTIAASAVFSTERWRIDDFGRE